VNPDSSAHSAGLSTTRKHTDDIRPRFDDSAACEDSGELGNTFRSAGQSYSANSTPDEVHVEFAPWRLTQSQFRCRGQPNVFDLGEL
jgi:hypothetical protein